MPISTREKQFGMKKEAVRGTAETAPDTYLGISSDTDLNYVLQRISDEMLKGVNATLPSADGVKVGEGTIKTSLRAQNVGELFQMCLGNPVTTETIASTVYKHAFSPPIAGIQYPSYTMFLKRGSLSTKKYSLGSVSQVSVTLPVDGLAEVEASVMFKTEEDGSFGSPSYTESEELAFQHAAFTLGGSSNCDIRDFSVNFQNGMIAQRTLCQTQDIKDLLANGEVKCEGSFTIFFENETERNKFLAGTASSLVVDLQGDEISGGENYYWKLTINRLIYTAYPHGEADGLFAAQVTFQAEYDTSNSRLCLLEIQNVKASY